MYAKLLPFSLTFKGFKDQTFKNQQLSHSKKIDFSGECGGGAVFICCFEIGALFVRSSGQP